MFKFMYSVKKKYLCRIFLNGMKKGKDMWELHSGKKKWPEQRPWGGCYLSDGERMTEWTELSDQEIE